MILEVKHLKKSFGDLNAVNDLSFNVNEGELFAFLGVNGAGKSTTINIICGQLIKDDGKVLVDGKDIEKNETEVKKEIGVVFQNSVLDKKLSVKDNLENRAALYNIHGEAFKKRLEELATLLNFKDLLKRKIEKLSGGQRRRIDIARALLHQPKILILDEPTTGLDPQTRKLLWDVFNELRTKEKMTIFLTTHYMEESSDADYVVIIDSGKKIAEGTPLELKNKYTGDFITIYNVSEEDVKNLNLPYIKIHDAYRVQVKNTLEASELIRKYPKLFTDFEVTKGKMDDVFLSITGKKLEGGNK